MGGLIVIGLVFMVIGMFVQWRLKSKFTEYSQVGLMNGMSGAEIATQMLRDNGIYDVRITQVEGMLTDHYNPADKTVNLSADVYHGRSVSSAAVAAHELGGSRDGGEVGHGGRDVGHRAEVSRIPPHHRRVVTWLASPPSRRCGR